MSVASRIQAIEEHIGNVYDTLDYAIDTTSENKNIVNIPKNIYNGYLDILKDDGETLFNNLPKVTGEGTSVTLNDTANSKMKIELEPSELSQDETPTPDYPQEIHTISGDNEIKIANSDNTQEQTLPLNLGDLEYCKIGDYEDEFVIPSGKNLFNSEMEMGVYAYADGEKANNAQYIRTKELTKVEPSEQYSISFEGVSPKTGSGFLFYKDGVYVSNIQTVAKTFEVPANANQVAYNLYIGSSASPSAIYKIQIEKGTATEYEPYNNGKWYLKKNIGKIVLNGSESWFSYNQTEYGGNWTYYVNISTSKKDFTNLSSKCNYFTFKDVSVPEKNIFTIGGVTTAKNNNYIFNFGDTANKLNDFKIWLETHNLIVYYPLQTPTYTLLNDTLQTQLNNIRDKVLAYQDQTNISQVNNDLPFRLKLSAIQKYTE